MPPPIAIYGALARFNYGDLLFPIILERALEVAGCDRPIHVVGLRRSDLSRYHAKTTLPVRWLAQPSNLPDGSKIIIAGGEVLAAGWGRLFSYLLPQGSGDQIYAIASRMFDQQRLDHFAWRRAGVPWKIPFCPRPADFANRVSILFNAVGGSGLADRDPEWRTAVSRSLDDAEYASVRDRQTYELLGKTCEFRPDSAAAMRDFFPPDWLRTKARDDLRPILEGPPYICFQLHRHFTLKKLQRFAAELDRCQREGGLRIVLLPIGRAAGHSDHVSLARVRSAMKTEAHLPKELGVFDIMALLAGSAIFAGTSLHGLISAMAYGRPYTILGKSPKCLACSAEWAPQELRDPLPANRFFEGIQERLGLDKRIVEDSSRRFREASTAGLDALVKTALAQ